MKIDSHQHFWRYDPAKDGWITDEMSVLKRDFMPEDLVPELEANGIDGCIAVQSDQSEKETLFLLQLAEQHKAIKGVVGWVDLANRELPERLRFFSKRTSAAGKRRGAFGANPGPTSASAGCYLIALAALTAAFS